MIYTLIQAKIARAEAEHAADSGSSVTDDILVKALGSDKNGRIRGRGYGVSKKSLVEKNHYEKIITEVHQRLAQLEVRNLVLIQFFLS